MVNKCIPISVHIETEVSMLKQMKLNIFDLRSKDQEVAYSSIKGIEALLGQNKSF